MEAVKKNEIPEVIEQLHHQWVLIPPPEDWPPDLDNIDPDQVRKIYAFYQGLRLGMCLSAACRGM